MSEPGRPANLTDVARAAGVSLTTASHTFSGHRPVSAATREKVLRAAAVLGFQPSSGTALVAILVRPAEVLPGFAFGTSFFAVVAGSVSVACLRRGFSAVVSTTLDDLLGTVRRPDGCVVVTPNAGDEVLAQLVDMDVPTVSFDPDPQVKSFQWWLGVNYRESTALLIDHLRRRGSVRVCAVVGQTDNQYRRGILAAYRAAAQRQPGGPAVRVVDNSLGQLGANECVTELLRSKNPPDAIITSSSVFAQGALSAALECGLTVPDDVRIGTCTDGPAAELASVPITALRLDANAAAETLIELLVRRMDGDYGPASTSHIVHQHLLQRSST